MARLFNMRSNYKKARKLKDTGAARGRLTRALRIILLVVGILLLVLPVMLLADPISYVPLIMAVLTLLISYGYVSILARSITVTSATGSYDCERGRQAGFAITLTNKSFLPAPRVELGFFMTNLFVEVADERTLVCSLAPNQTTDAVFDATFAHVGKYEAGVHQVRIYDLLGVFSRTQKDSARSEILVHPAKVNMAGIGNNEVVADESNHMLKPIASDNEDYSSVREYHRGDPMKTVHWNLSSRNADGKLYTRLYEEYVNPSLAIVVDCFAPDLDSDTQMSLFDGIVECACALCAEAQISGIEAELRFIRHDMEKAATHLSNEADVISLIGDMHRIVSQSEAGDDALVVEEMLRAAGLQTNGFGNIAFITSRADSGCLDALTSIRARRRNVMAFVSLPRDLDERKRNEFCAPFAALQSVGAYCYSVESTPIATEVASL